MKAWLSDIPLMWCALWLWVSAIHGGGERTGLLVALGVVLVFEGVGRSGRASWVRWGAVVLVTCGVAWLEPRWPLGSAFPLGMVGVAGLGTLGFLHLRGHDVAGVLALTSVSVLGGVVLRVGQADGALWAHALVVWVGMAGLLRMAEERSDRLGALPAPARFTLLAAAYGALGVLGSEASGIWRWDMALAPAGPGVPWIAYAVIPVLALAWALVGRAGLEDRRLGAYLRVGAAAFLAAAVLVMAAWLVETTAGSGSQGLLRRAAIRWGLESPDLEWRPGGPNS